MKKSRQSSHHPSWLFGVFFSLLFVSIPAMAAQKHPVKPYTPADRVFEACDLLTGGDLTKCCSERSTVCDSECTELRDNPESWPRGPGGFIVCLWDCDDGEDSCRKGEKTKKLIAWPGEDHLPIPGVFIDESRIATDDGIGLNMSTDTAVFEIRRDGVERGQSACVTIVASCNCPEGLEYDTKSKECLPAILSGAIECRICSTGKSSEDCKPCDDCQPVVMFAQPCAVVEIGEGNASTSTP